MTQAANFQAQRAKSAWSSKNPRDVTGNVGAALYADKVAREEAVKNERLQAERGDGLPVLSGAHALNLARQGGYVNGEVIGMTRSGQELVYVDGDAVVLDARVRPNRSDQ